MIEDSPQKKHYFLPNFRHKNATFLATLYLFITVYISMYFLNFPLNSVYQHLSINLNLSNPSCFRRHCKLTLRKWSVFLFISKLINYNSRWLSKSSALFILSFFSLHFFADLFCFNRVHDSIGNSLC